MNKPRLELKFGIVTLMIFVAAMSRLLPHPPNFTAIGGMALFGAALYQRKWLAFAVPFIALWFSDLIMNNTIYAQYYEGFVFFSASSLWIYGAIAAIVIMGSIVLRKIKLTNLFASSIIASILFFLVTNFGTWMSSGMYPKTGAGLMACLTAGIPFFWSTLAGDLFFVAVLFGSYALITNQSSSLLATSRH